jgi:hypothetical protein
MKESITKFCSTSIVATFTPLVEYIQDIQTGKQVTDEIVQDLFRISKTASQLITLALHAKLMKKASLQLWNYCVNCRQGGEKQTEDWIVKCKELKNS